MWKLVSEMLLNIVDVVCCENPECRSFAHIVTNVRAQTYYCPICGCISYARPVDSAMTANQAQFESYLRRLIESED